MKLSCLVVTKNRPAFHPWLAWNITKQTRPPDEVIIIDSTPMTDEYREQVDDLLRSLKGICAVHFPAPPAYTTGESRNDALDRATGEIITWIDDDDWHHPKKHELLGAAIEKGYDIAYFANTHRLILETMELINIGETEGQVSVPFSAVRADIAHKHSFPSTFTAEDVHWLTKVKQDCKEVYFHRTFEVPTMALIHGSNTWNRPDLPEYNFYKQVTDTRFPEHAPYGVSAEEWAETTLQLAALKERLGNPNSIDPSPASSSFEDPNE